MISAITQDSGEFQGRLWNLFNATPLRLEADKMYEKGELGRYLVCVPEGSSLRIVDSFNNPSPSYMVQRLKLARESDKIVALYDLHH